MNDKQNPRSPRRVRAIKDADIAQLKALGYTSNFDRSMTELENFSLGFTYLSPVVGVYTLFASALAAGGPPMFWSYVVVGIGQMFVCLVFGEVVSQFPISGGLYPWARRLVGKRWAWMAGWVYGWALYVSISAIATGGAPFLAQLLGFTPTSTITTATMAMMHDHDLDPAECQRHAAAGARGDVRFHLRADRRHRGGLLPVGFRTPAPDQRAMGFIELRSLGHRCGHYLPAFLASALSALFCYYGFEACGDVAEETPNASRMIPRAMRMTIYVGGAAAMWVCLGLILSVPDMQAVIAGKDTDPVATILRSAMGEWGFRAVIAVVLVSFMSCMISMQAAASRLLFAYARDQMIVGMWRLSQLSPHTRGCRSAALLTGGGKRPPPASRCAGCGCRMRSIPSSASPPRAFTSPSRCWCSAP